MATYLSITVYNYGHKYFYKGSELLWDSTSTALSCTNNYSTSIAVSENTTYGAGGWGAATGTYSNWNITPYSAYGGNPATDYSSQTIYFYFYNEKVYDSSKTKTTTRSKTTTWSWPSSFSSINVTRGTFLASTLRGYPTAESYTYGPLYDYTNLKIFANSYISYGSYSVTLADRFPEKEGYTQTGWYCFDGPYAGNTYSVGGGFDVYAGSAPGYTEHYFRAVWTPIKYNIKYDSNGGSGTMSTIKDVEYDSNITLGPCKFTRKNYEFLGWGIEPDGKVKYKDGASVKNLTSEAGKTVILYAIWDPKGFEVTYIPNAGDDTVTNMPKTQLKFPDEILTLSKEIPKRNSKVETATVTYINDGGTSIDKGTVTKTTTYTINKEGYYWNTYKSGTGTTYKPGDQYTENKALTLYAKWYSLSNTVSVTIPTAVHGNTSETKKVIFDPNGGNVNPSSKNYTVTTTYKFKNWTTQTGGKGTIYNAGDKYSKIANLVLYANYTATRNSEKITLPTPTKSGSVFKGWYNSANKLVGSGGDSYAPSVDGETLTAQWYAGTMVNFHPNNGKADYSIMIPYNQSTYYTLTLPNKPGYYFDGWTIDNGPLKGKVAYNWASSTTCTGNANLKTMWKNKAWIYTDTPTLDLTAKWVHADSFVFFGREPGEDLTNGYWCPIQGYIYDGSKWREIETFKVFDGDFWQEGEYHGN